MGELAVINVAVTTVVQLGSFGLPSSNTYFIAQDPSSFARRDDQLVIFAAMLGVLGLALS